MDPENQIVTVAVKTDAHFDSVALTEAIESGGYKVEEIFTLTSEGARENWSP